MAKTYADLKSDVASFMHRGDLTSVIPTFVALAESEIFRTHPSALRVREMEDEATITITALAGNLPANYLDARYLRMTGVPDVTYAYLPPDNWNNLKAGTFTVIGEEIRLPTGASGTCKLVYFAQPDALTLDADTNDVLDAFYGAYLYATLKQAAIYTRNTQAGSEYQALMDQVLSQANKRNRNHIGPLTVRAA